MTGKWDRLLSLVGFLTVLIGLLVAFQRLATLERECIRVQPQWLGGSNEREH